jgi:Ser/Thr protein kinase RdoA (MazF antagonist)
LSFEWSRKVSPKVERLFRFLEGHVADLEAHLWDLENLPELVIHGDYYGENLIMQGAKVVAVIDFDQAHWCPRALEVAEALIYFAVEHARLEQIVYSGALDLGVAESFMEAYGQVARLTDAELEALPHFVRLIWMCAALDPPLLPRMRARDARRALPEVLYLADWARSHAAELVDIGMSTRKRA